MQKIYGRNTKKSKILLKPQNWFTEVQTPGKSRFFIKDYYGGKWNELEGQNKYGGEPFSFRTKLHVLQPIDSPAQFFN